MTTKKTAIILVALATLTALGLANLEKNEVPYVDVNGETITFPYTDDNSGEDLIIRTNKQEYHAAGYNELITSYLAIGNTGNTDTIDLIGYFPEEANIKSIATLEEDKVYEYEVPIYEERCVTNDIVASSTKKTATTTETCSQVQIDTKTATSTRDEWTNVAPKPFSIKRVISEKKFVPSELVKRQTSGVVIKNNEIKVFRVQFTTSQSKGSKEFFFEAVGGKGYGHLK